MLRRTLKVIAVAAAIVFVPYFVGIGMLRILDMSDPRYEANWVFGSACSCALTGIGSLVGMLLRYIRTGSIHDY